MKHTLRITLVLIGLFLLAQFIGMVIVNSYVSYKEVIVEGVAYTEKTWEELPYEFERPEFEQKTSFIPILLIILVATFVVLLIVKFGAIWLWKLWFFLAVLFCLGIAFGAFLPEIIAMGLALLLAFIKLSRRSIFIHNFTELFIYGGLAAIFVPVLSLLGISILLVLISIYDFVAVWKTKHMVTLAKFQSKAKLFAGLFVPYGKKKHAVLGGGDIGFPLMFTAVVMGTYGLGAIVVSIFATIGLAFLLFMSKKNKFYPAMPFITAGCFVGYLLLYLLSSL